MAQPDKDAILEQLDMKSSSHETSEQFTFNRNTHYC